MAAVGIKATRRVADALIGRDGTGPQAWPGWTATRTARTDPCADSFALDEVGCVLLSALRDRARDSPTTAVVGIARSIIRFTANVIPDPDHPDTADTLETMRDERLVCIGWTSMRWSAPVGAACFP